MPRPVKIERAEAETFALEWLEKLCAEEMELVRRKASAPSGDGTQAGEISVRADAQPPFEKFDAAKENADRFRDLWDGKKRSGDTSQSGYDMSLACATIPFGWTNQEIVDLLIAHRKKRLGEGPERAGYYARTLRSARDFMAGLKAKAESKIKAEAEENISGEIEQAIRGGPETALAKLSEKLAMPVAGFVQRDGNPPEHYLRVEGFHEIGLGTAKQLLSLSSVRAEILSATGLLPPFRKQKAWDDIVKLLFSIVEKVDIPEGRRHEETREWIALYLESCALPDRRAEVADDSWHKAVKDQDPFCDSDRKTVHFTTAGLQRFLKSTDTALCAAGALRSRISEIRFKSEPVSAKVKGKNYCRSYWAGTLPPENEEHGSNYLVIAEDNGKLLKNQGSNNGITKIP